MPCPCVPSAARHSSVRGGAVPVQDLPVGGDPVRAVADIRVTSADQRAPRPPHPHTPHTPPLGPIIHRRTIHAGAAGGSAVTSSHTQTHTHTPVSRRLIAMFPVRFPEERPSTSGIVLFLYYSRSRAASLFIKQINIIDIFFYDKILSRLKKHSSQSADTYTVD